MKKHLETGLGFALAFLAWGLILVGFHLLLQGKAHWGRLGMAVSVLGLFLLPACFVLVEQEEKPPRFLPQTRGKEREKAA